VPELDLFDKTELWLVGATLTDARLPDVAAAAASALALRTEEVFVTDVRDDHIVFDVVAPWVQMDAVLGRADALLRAVGDVPGVVLAPDAALHSRGVLGMLGAPAEQVPQVLAAAATLEANLRAYVSRRVAVVSSGPEVIGGSIHDTNLETISAVMTAAGCEVSFGGVVDDDERAIAGRVARLVEDGYGIVITTGGVGAEDKDRTIEAFELLAASLPGTEVGTAVLATYEVGHGRHVKPHVRVASARIGEDAVAVALPGPTREVAAAVPALLAALQRGDRPAEMAEAVAAPIRALWRDRPGHSDHQHVHPTDDGGR